MKFKGKEHGFGALEALLILIIVGIVGFVGWYVYHAKNSTDSTYNNAANTNVTAQSTVQKTSEQPNKTKFNEYFSSFTLGKLALGKQVGPPINVPTDTTVFSVATDQFCTNMTLKKTIPQGSYAEANYNVSTKQSDNPTKITIPREVTRGGTIGCEPLQVSAGKYEYKAYIDGVLVIDSAYAVK